MRVCVFGDSIVWGAFDPTGRGWVGRLAEAGLRRKDAQTGGRVAVYNCGAGGDKVVDVLNRFERDANVRDPVAIVIAIGINDARHDDYPGTRNDEFARVYAELVDMSRARAEDVVLVTPTNVDERRPEHNYRNTDIAGLASAVKGLAAARDIRIVDVFGSMTPSDLSPDGLHPGGEGHQKLFDIIAPAVFALPSLNP